MFDQAAAGKALVSLHTHAGKQTYGPYGFPNALNEDKNWLDPDVLRLGLGIATCDYANAWDGTIWKTFTKHTIVTAGLRAMGYSGKVLHMKSKQAPITPVPIRDVQIQGGIFKESMEVGRKVLHSLDVDRMLYAFRFQAGLPTLGAKPYESWATPEPHGAFPGFYESHYLSAISKMSANVYDDDKVLRTRVHTMVHELGKCQRAMGGRYLFASPEAEFDVNRLDGVVWYRMHKLLEGLIAARVHAGSAQALQIAIALVDWIEERTTRYGAELHKVKKVEYGGMAEALANVFSITKNPRHLALAQRWLEPPILDKFASGGDYMEHANTLIVKIVGAARIAELTGSEHEHKAALGFWDKVVTSGGRTYATGGLSVHEGMPPQKRLAGTQSRMPQETCVSYNLIKIGHSLAAQSGDSRIHDHIERTLFNAILGSQDPRTGWKTYYQPLSANSVKDFRSNERGCYCCNGTGLENPAQYGQFIYSTQGDDTVCINQYIDSAANISKPNIRIYQWTQFPLSDTVKVVISAMRPQVYTIKLRVPQWCDKPMVGVNVNGKPTAAVQAKGWITLRRTWSRGDCITLRLPMNLRMEAMPDNDQQAAFVLGPQVLVVAGAHERLSEVVLYPSPGESEPGRLFRLAARAKRLAKNEPDGAIFTLTDDIGRVLRLKPYAAVGGGEFFTGYIDVVQNPSRFPQGNVALGKRVIVADPAPPGVNVECFLRADKLVDGCFGDKDDWYTKWFPNGLEPQWATIDLGRLHVITKTVWVPAKEDIDAKKAYRYRIDLSDDNKTWRDYADRSAVDNVGSEYVDERLAKARYVRLTLTPRKGGTENIDRPKVAEVMIFGKPVAQR